MIEADFHIHSKYSQDSFLSPRSIIKMAKRKGLSAIAVTDHETVKGAMETIREARISSDLLIVSGIEVRTNIGDLIGLFVEEDIATRDFYEVIDEVRDQDGLVVLSHPSRGHKNMSKQMMLEIDIVEALNGRSSGAKNLEAKKLALSLNKPVVGGSDAHFSFEIGSIRTIFFSSVTSLEDLRKLVVSGERKLIGRESPAIVHGFSFGVEIIKRVIG
ncbi:MAG: PHP domain-containing protein [Candidatus Bathyarchaeota archaeon]|nr:PHP domain-containing protein [Candidatus Bathyarchaeota archaeon]